MDLQEEYFLRNDVSKSPIRFNANGSILLETPNTVAIGGKWRFLNIGASNMDGDPGKFELRVYYPQHNGSRNGGILACAAFNEKEDRCWWESYEDKVVEYCTKVVKNYGCKAVLDRNHIELACWEILLYSNDSYIAEMPIEIMEIFHRVLDTNLNAIERSVSLIESLNFIEKTTSSMPKSKALHQGWLSLQDYIRPKNYAVWLAKIIGT